ncbi:50S ribosomal protein L21 [Carboxydochorda subterranea]|uniref:Large ribosomal subunit protein bL21 n=1 Tax=Carboxydichorda subterranea TaxID=3109565 RepID=A0ABZ1C0B9_9FIRM|nr:50S ribosomal protein L21 [Limnochorda sp. L945t]WRP18226.1 50S ribosomal protein L21 [Limnochorda sp. L945t]
MADYAVVELGGRQYRVSPGDLITVERIAANVGDEVPVERVLMVRQGERTIVGRPTVEGARATARVVEHGRGRKVLVFKYKPKVNYRRRRGHRQPFTRLEIRSIEGPAT